MKLHKRTFRSVPNPMFVQKSQEAVEGGSSNLIINELQLTQEEISTLLQNRPVVLEATDPRIELFNTSDILTVTLFGDKYSAFVMKNPDSATARFLSFQVLSSVFVLVLFEEEGNYSLNFITDEFASSEQINSILGQIDILAGDISDCIKYTEIDDELSATSTNPVQNKVIYEALQGGKYLHHIFFTASNTEGKYDFFILNNSLEAFTEDTLYDYLYNAGFTSRSNYCDKISGVYFRIASNGKMLYGNIIGIFAQTLAPKSVAVEFTQKEVIASINDSTITYSTSSQSQNWDDITVVADDVMKL